MDEMQSASFSWRGQISILFPVPEFNPRKGGLCAGKTLLSGASSHCVPASCVKLWAWDLPYEIHTKGGVFCFVLFCFYNTTTNQSHPLMPMKQSTPPTECTEGHCRLDISRPSSLGYQAHENHGPG